MNEYYSLVDPPAYELMVDTVLMIAGLLDISYMHNRSELCE